MRNAFGVSDKLLERLRLLADVIPALSHAVGAIDIKQIPSWNMQDLKSFPNNNAKWPQKNDAWGHSAIRALAYPFSFRVFDLINSELRLNE